MSSLVVVPTFLTEPIDLEVTHKMLVSLRATEPEVDVLLVDDGSPATPLVDELAEMMSGFKSELIRKEENSGFARTVNIGLKRALESGQNAILLNADVELIDVGWVARMEQQQREDNKGTAAIVGGLLLYPNGLIQHAGIFFSLLHRCFEHIYKYAPADLPEAQAARTCPVTGALQLIRHDCLEAIGLYDENFRLGWEDVDYCLRAFMAGGNCVMQPKVRAFHYESMFRGRPSAKVSDWQARSWMYFLHKYANVSFAEYVPSLI
jgi:GT2 family glycosyltransferase